jgi:hypothetical protein
MISRLRQRVSLATAPAQRARLDHPPRRPGTRAERRPLDDSTSPELRPDPIVADVVAATDAVLDAPAH